MTHRFADLSSPSDYPLTAEDVAKHVAHHVDDWHRYAWHFREKFPLRKIGRLPGGTSPFDVSPQGWIRWLEKERCGEGGRDMWGSDFVHWLTTGGLYAEDCAIIVTELPGGDFGVHDGNHRVAVAHEQGMDVLPAFVGYVR